MPSTTGNRNTGLLTPRSGRTQTELEEFGFRPPRVTRGYQIPLFRGGAESLRRGKIMLAVTGVAGVLLFLFTLGCGASGGSACGNGLWVLLILLAFAAIAFGLQLWFIAAVPPEFEDPRHPAVAGEFAAGQQLYPSRDAIFDPEYDQVPHR